MNPASLERPDLFEPSFTKPLARKIGHCLLSFSQIEDNKKYEPNVAILVRTKNNEVGLSRIFTYIENLRDNYKGRVDAVVVDTESTDGTIDLARDFGAFVVPLLQKEFTYPKSLNEGLAAVKDDIEATFLTVGHAQPVLSNMINLTAYHFADPNVSGVYGKSFPHENASMNEKILSNKMPEARRSVDHIEMGVMAATNSMIRMSTWRDYEFDESYGAGGEDTAWADAALKRGESIMYEPAAAVHHSHGLGLINTARQWKHWSEVLSGPGVFNGDEVMARRPDLWDQ